MIVIEQGKQYVFTLALKFTFCNLLLYSSVSFNECIVKNTGDCSFKVYSDIPGKSGTFLSAWWPVHNITASNTWSSVRPVVTSLVVTLHFPEVLKSSLLFTLTTYQKKLTITQKSISTVFWVLLRAHTNIEYQNELNVTKSLYFWSNYIFITMQKLPLFWTVYTF